MSNLDNLKSLGDRPPEERSEIARKGQAAAAAQRKKNTALRHALQNFLDGPSGVKDKNGKELSGTELMVAVAVKEMSRGNPKFWELIRDTSGQKPVEQIMVAEVDPAVIDEVESLVDGLNEEGTSNAP